MRFVLFHDSYDFYCSCSLLDKIRKIEITSKLFQNEHSGSPTNCFIKYSDSSLHPLGRSEESTELEFCRSVVLMLENCTTQTTTITMITTICVALFTTAPCRVQKFRDRGEGERLLLWNPTVETGKVPQEYTSIEYTEKISQQFIWPTEICI